MQLASPNLPEKEKNWLISSASQVSTLSTNQHNTSSRPRQFEYYINYNYSAALPWRPTRAARKKKQIHSAQQLPNASARQIHTHINLTENKCCAYDERSGTTLKGEIPRNNGSESRNSSVVNLTGSPAIQFRRRRRYYPYKGCLLHAAAAGFGRSIRD